MNQALEAKNTTNQKHDQTVSATMTMKSGTVYIANTPRQTATAANQPNARSQPRRVPGAGGGDRVSLGGMTDRFRCVRLGFRPRGVVPVGWGLP